MTTVYQKHDKAFSQVNAYAILKDGKHIANINLKYPKDGAGRLQCFIHIHGSEMQNSWVSGCWYDKRSSAISKTAQQYIKYTLDEAVILEADEMEFLRILATGEAHNGNWDHLLYKNGFTKINVI